MDYISAAPGFTLFSLDSIASVLTVQLSHDIHDVDGSPFDILIVYCLLSQLTTVTR